MAKRAAKTEEASAEVAPPEPVKIVSASRVRALLSYDPKTGVLRWLSRRGPKAAAGQIAGSKHCAGYLAIRIDRRAYLSHRIAWLHVHGNWPKDQIDHINGDRTDNRLVNLRECSNAENSQNVRSHKGSTSKHTGVSYSSRGEKRPWSAQICVSGKQRIIGRFETEGAALSARLAAKRELHKFHPVQEQV